MICFQIQKFSFIFYYFFFIIQGCTNVDYLYIFKFTIRIFNAIISTTDAVNML